MTQATYYSKELKAYNELKESLHDLWAEMESDKLTLEQAHSSITALERWLKGLSFAPKSKDKSKCEDEVFAIDDCTPHQYEEMRAMYIKSRNEIELLKKNIKNIEKKLIKK